MEKTDTHTHTQKNKTVTDRKETVISFKTFANREKAETETYSKVSIQGDIWQKITKAIPQNYESYRCKEGNLT